MVYFARLNEPLKLLRRTSGPNGLRPIWQTSGNSAPWSASPPDNYCFTSAEENGMPWWFVPWTISWHKYLWAIQPRTWSMILFRSMQKFDLSQWGVPSAIWSTMASTTPKRQWWWDSNAIKIPHQSRFGIKPVEFPQPDRNELYYVFNTLMKPAAPKAIAVFG